MWYPQMHKSTASLSLSMGGALCTGMVITTIESNFYYMYSQISKTCLFVKLFSYKNLPTIRYTVLMPYLSNSCTQTSTVQFSKYVMCVNDGDFEPLFCLIVMEFEC